MPADVEETGARIVHFLERAISTSKPAQASKNERVRFLESIDDMTAAWSIFEALRRVTIEAEELAALLRQQNYAIGLYKDHVRSSGVTIDHGRWLSL